MFQGARRGAVFLTLVVLGITACKAKGSDSKPSPPAKVDKPTKEVDLNTITLTPEAEARLGLRTATVERKKIQRTRALGGEAVVPPGLAVTVAAPIGGTLAPVGKTALRPGALIEKGKALFTLTPAAADRIQIAQNKASLAALSTDADAAVARAKVDLEAAKISLDRADKLAQDNVGSAQQRDDAQARAKLAEASLTAAEARRSVLAKTASADAASGAPITIESPMSGTLQRLYALPGQVVAPGTPLFEVDKLDPIWVKIAVYVGDLGSIDAAKDALVGTLASAEQQAVRVARPVPAPPSANPQAATVDLFYELDNTAAALFPGQSVSVTLPLRSEEESLVLPWAAVVHDIHGGAWVYENTGPHTYARRRVQVRYVLEGTAALASGPKPGAAVVTEGAAELFGVEFGVGK